MGIHQAFLPIADFSDMTTLPVYVDKVIHKAKIKVDEQGSEAAAVTDVTMRKNSIELPPSGVIEFHDIVIGILLGPDIHVELRVFVRLWFTHLIILYRRLEVQTDRG